MLTYNEDLDTNSAPAADAYTVQVDGAAGPAVSSVSVSGATVTLTLAPAVTSTDTDVTVSYSPENATHPVRDASGIDARAFTDRTVTNNTAVSTDATLSALALADGNDEAVDLAPVFAATTTDYTAAVGNAVAQITVTPTKSHSAAMVTYPNTTDANTNALGHQVNLDVGDNDIQVKVTAEDTSYTETYTVTVTRATAFVCPTPDLGDRTAVWSGTLTVGTGQDTYGYSTASGVLDLDYGSLDNTQFTYGTGRYGGDDYVIESIVEFGSTSATPNALYFDLDRSLTVSARERLRLHVCNDAFELGSAVTSAVLEHAFHWSDAVLDWSTATTVELALSAFNNAATGRPTIAGTAQVGHTLTAGADDIADADGLPPETFPAGYTFQWVRVDGSTETDVGAGAHTYTPVAADVDTTLLVEVTFTDREGNVETVRSDAVGPVVAAPEGCSARLHNDWCTTLMVKEHPSADGTAWGYSSTDGYGALADPHIDHGADSQTVERVLIWRPDVGADEVIVGFTSGRVRHGARFNLGGAELETSATAEDTNDTPATSGTVPPACACGSTARR